MSHFTVLIIGDNVDKQLDPFWELDLTEEDAKNDYRSEFNLEYTKVTAEERRLEKAKEDKSKKYASMSEAEFMKGYCGYVYNEEQEGYGYYRNPNAKWDWFLVGGRWKGYFKALKGCSGELGEPGVGNNEAKKGYYDVIKRGDIDFDAMRKVNFEAAHKNWEEHLKRLKSAEKNYNPYFDMGVYKDDTKDIFVRRLCSVATFAVLKDGEWYERGEMGWWACVIDEKDQKDWDEEWEKLVMELPDDTLLTVVDCHI